PDKRITVPTIPGPKLKDIPEHLLFPRICLPVILDAWHTNQNLLGMCHQI
ncbi:7400_t:CDS:1, partial [Acaulospora morrowiae]